MRLAFPIVLLSASIAVGQMADVSHVQSPAPITRTRSGNPVAPSLSPSTPVITIVGLCDGSQPGARAAGGKQEVDACKTVITRKQFDALAEAIQPHMSTAGKTQLASFYPKLLLMQREYRKLGLASDPSVKEAIAFANLRAEAEETAKILKSRSDEAAPEAAIEKYYKENASIYEQTEWQRLFIPEDKSAPSVKQNSADTKAPVPFAPTEDAYKRRIESMRARAVAGEDLDNLQAEVYKSAGMVEAAPKTNIGNLAISELPANHRSIMTLKTGEVSEPLAAANGTYIYKALSKSTKPLDEVRPEIKARLAEEIFTQSMQSIERSAKVEINTAYFPLGATSLGPMGSPSSLGKGFGAKGFGSGKGSRGGVRTSVPARVVVPTPQPTSAAPVTQ